MRMWMVDPKCMCDKHLLGEHVELHMFIGTIKKGVSLQGYVDNGLIETKKIYVRHNELVAEMERRGMKHKSPLPNVNFEKLPKAHFDATVSVEESLAELQRRCPACHEKITAR